MAILINLANELLIGFMLALALLPLALATLESRRRAAAGERLRALRHEARIAAVLRARRPAATESATVQGA